MKLVVVLSRFPYPLDKGDKLRAYHQIKGLSLQNDICLICTSDEPVSQDSIRKLEAFCKEIHVFRLAKPLIWLRLIWAVFSKKPFQVHYFFSPLVALKIRKAIDSFGPEHIYAQLIRTTEYVKNYHLVPKTMDYMDAFNKGYERRKNLSTGFMRWFLSEESKRLLSYEHLIFDYFDHHTIISEQDRKLIYHAKRDTITVIPNGVDLDYFSPASDEIKFDLLFTGNMAYPPNESSALFLLEEILPLIHLKKPNVTVAIAGADPSSALMSKANSKIHITGRIADIRTAYRQSRVFVAPMLLGTGLQNKLLEAMAMNLPCVTSELANNALNAEEGHQILIGRSARDYADQIIHLLENELLGRNIGTAGHAFVRSSFDWSKSVQALTGLICPQPKN